MVAKPIYLMNNTILSYYYKGGCTLWSPLYLYAIIPPSNRIKADSIFPGHIREDSQSADQ